MSQATYESHGGVHGIEDRLAKGLQTMMIEFANASFITLKNPANSL